METDKKYSDDFNSLDTDFRAEAVIAGLIGKGQDEERTVTVRQRGNLRNVSKDIHKSRYVYSDYDLLEYLYIYTNRPGFYDSLPEGIFHQPANSMRQRSADDIVREIRNQRNEESLVRKFFQPFEMAIDQILVDAQLYEQKFDKAYIHDNLCEIFKDQWDILQYMTLKQGLLFLRTIPFITEILSDMDKMSTVIGIILDCPVSIREGQRSRTMLPEDEKKGLGKCKLGVNFVLGKSVESDNPDLEITIGPISTKEMKSFQSNGSNKQILTRLIDLVIPFDRNKNIHYKLFKSETKFKLSGKEHTAYLGINTRL
ncbi:MAG: type VI secretion system baseplate subunit TssG [Dysgonomonas sp.]